MSKEEGRFTDQSECTDKTESYWLVKITQEEQKPSADEENTKCSMKFIAFVEQSAVKMLQ